MDEIAKLDASPVPASVRTSKWRRRYNREYVRQVTEKPTGTNTLVLTAKGKAAVAAASAGGMALGVIARDVLGISVSAFKAMRDREPEVQELIEYGREHLSDELYDILLMQARDGNTTAAIFLARSRAGWNNDAGAIEGLPARTVNVQQNINISLVEPMSEAELRALISPPVKVIENDPAD